jgi:O-antigen chain-terminating methyltransferase
MLETNNPQVDLTELLEKIECELREQNKQQQKDKCAALATELVINDPYAWAQLSETLKVAEINIDAGAEVTTMHGYRGIKRKIIRFSRRVAFFVGRLITIPQRNFNNAILHTLRIVLDGIRDMNRNTALLEKQMAQLEEKSLIVDYLKTGMVAQERRVFILLEELRNQVASGEKNSVTAIEGTTIPDILDPLYLAFENRFRGTREEIRERLLEYIPLMRDAGAGTEDRLILDIGCGRGEWLELMADEGLAAKGLDLNSVLVEQCRQKGFHVEQNDALNYLRSLPDNTLGAITSFHLIEHLDFDTRVALFDESVRVLKPSGIALFETPNPRNLLVGACNFWADPTHLRPLYPETHEFLMEYRGFSQVKLRYLHPHEGEQCLPGEEAPQLAARLNEVLSCARDYAIIGYKK